jgi:hypothetical protein
LSRPPLLVAKVRTAEGIHGSPDPKGSSKGIPSEREEDASGTGLFLLDIKKIETVKGEYQRVGLCIFLCLWYKDLPESETAQRCTDCASVKQPAEEFMVYSPLVIDFSGDRSF